MSEIKDYPTPGFRYRVKKGEFINHIAGQAYGDNSKWPRISEANARNVKGPDAGTGGDQQWFFPGDIIFIPPIQELEKLKIKTELPDKEKYEVTLIIEDVEMNFKSMRLIRTMDTVADGATFVIAWEPFKDPDIDRVTSPYGYQNAKIYIGGKLIINGTLYNVRHESTKEGKSKELQIFSNTADLIDTTPAEPYELNNQNLEQIAKQRCRPFGIDVIVDLDADIGGIFKRATADKTASTFDHLRKLARQRGLLLSSTEQGDLLITIAKTDTEPIGTIKESLPQSQDFSIAFNGRGRYNTYKAISQTPKKRGVTSIAIDTVVPKPRRKAVTTDQVLSGELTSAAEWEKNKSVAENLQCPFPVTDWYGPDNELLEPNTLVVIESDTLAEKGFTFLIRQVEFVLENNERTAIINIVPPSMYTKNSIEEPWIKE